MTYAEVIPLLRLPRSLEVFDYKVPPDLEASISVGQAALIRFRGRVVTGIIANLKDQSTAAVATIDKLLDSIPLIDARTLTLLRDFAEDAFVAPGLFLRHALPEVPKKPITSAPYSPLASSPVSLTITRDLGEKLKTTLAAIQKYPEIHLRVDDACMVEPLLLRLAMEAQTTRKSLLILVPIQEHAVALATSLRTHGIAATCTLPADAKIKTYALWQACARGDTPVVVGTRNALFFPMHAGGRYVLIDETAEEWKQSEINPRLDARIILPKLAAHHRTTYITITPQCPISFPAPAHEEDMRIHEPQEVTITTIPRATIFSESLIAAIEDKKNALFFVHRKGKAALLRCRDCGFTATCPSCALAFAVHRTFLRCTACDTRMDLPLACLKCNSAELKTYGVGTEQVEEAARETFPDAAITVTTSALLNRWPITESTPLFDLVAVVEADTMLHRPDFRSQEKLARTINRLGQIAGAKSAPLIIQTTFPELAVWTSGGAREEQWIKEEYGGREALHYPPFWRMAKLIFQNKDQKTAHTQAATFHHAIINAAKDCAVEINEPAPATPPKVRGQYRYLVILRFKPEQYDAVKPHLAALPDDVIIDLDPSDILR